MNDTNDVVGGRGLTQAQFLMWLGQQLNPDVPLYNMIQTFRISGDLDHGAFGRAWERFVEGSDAMRTVVLVEDGQPRQADRAPTTSTIEFIDLSAEPSPYDAYLRWQDARKLVLHDLGRRLFDCALVRLSDNDHIWYLNNHHLITDGRSFANTFRHVAENYELALDGRLDEAPPRPRYADYIGHEAEHRAGEGFGRAADHWAERVAVEVEPIDLYGRTAGSELGRTDRITVDLGEERSKLIREIAMTEGFASVSSDLSLATVWNTLLLAALHRIADRDVLRLGTPYQGRPTPAFKDTVGLFIEIGVTQVEVAEDETFTSLGRKVMRELFTGLANARPGISNADINRSYDVLLNYVNARFDDFAGLPVRTDWVHTGFGDGNHLLRLQVTDFDGVGAFTLSFDVNAQVFGDDQRAWLLAQFDRVIDAFIEDHERALGSFSLLDDHQRDSLVVDFNRTDVEYEHDLTVVDHFESRAAAMPDATAAIRGDETISYRELNRAANRLAHLLREQGVGPGERVAIHLERSIEVLIAIWGVMKAGGAYVPIDPANPDRRTAHLVADAAPVALVVDRNEVEHADGADFARELGVPVIDLSASSVDLARRPDDNPVRVAGPDDLAYVIYTSGSTGQPKGTMVTHRGLNNYVTWAARVYRRDAAAAPEVGAGPAFPLYSSLAFDLTITSIFVPLVSGGRIVVYNESDHVRGMEVLEVFRDDAVDVVKLTPAHLELVADLLPATRRIDTLIVGGEDFKTDLAVRTAEGFGRPVAQFNEYGPTEAVVGCMLHRFDPVVDTGPSVPIGSPAANCRIHLLDRYGQPVPPGVLGEMWISSDGVAAGYLNRPDLTAERFENDPDRPGARRYRTGDVARWGSDDRLIFLGRQDDQVKIGSARIELGEVHAAVVAHPAVREATLIVVGGESDPATRADAADVAFCVRCGLPSNYPDVSFDEEDVCEFCTDFDRFHDDVFAYFKNEQDLTRIVDEAKANAVGDYDCMLLFSGGKDSSYVLSQLVERGLRVLAWSLDNGYISDDAKANMRGVTDQLGVDLVIAATPHMNAIFADSLQRFSNVCHGCYKTIYTLAMNEARTRGVRHIFTGLSRGQLFETRLHELFRNRTFDVEEMDHAIAQSRKVYHRVDDAVGRLLDVEIFADDRVFDEISFVDFFRYTDVRLEEMYDFLANRVPWIRPGDTGRSTNCLINEMGIHVHKTERGYHNYALPYSWDVRLGHKTRDEALEELDDEIRMAMVEGMLDDVGYEIKPRRGAGVGSERRLAAYYVPAEAPTADVPAEGQAGLTPGDLRRHLAVELPDFMIPAHLVPVEHIPLTINGKVDRTALPDANEQVASSSDHVAPASAVETEVAGIWSEILGLSRIGVHDDYFELGGTSVPSIQIVARIGQAFGIDFPLRSFFDSPTVALQSQVVEELVMADLDAMSDDEVEAMLAELEG